MLLGFTLVVVVVIANIALARCFQLEKRIRRLETRNANLLRIVKQVWMP